ncbi:protein kinase, variant 2 [Mucor circinelloides]
MDEATQVFELGISNEAVPLKRLRRNYDLFKARMQERQRRGLLHKQQMEAKRQMESLKSTGQRTMLGQKFDSHSRVSVPANVHANIEARFGTMGALGSSSGPQSRSFGNSTYSTSSRIPSTMSSPSESFSVFTETTSAQPSSSSSSASRSSILPAARSSLPSSASHSLHSSTTSAAFRRENQRPTEKFTGARIRQSSLPTPPAVIEKFQVYQDPQDGNTSDNTSLERANSTSSMLSVSLGEGSESIQSKQRRFPAMDPTQKKKRRKDREAQQKVTVVPEFLEARFMQRRHSYFQSRDTKGGVEYIPIPQHHNHNISFEELRAANKNYHTQLRTSVKGKEKAVDHSQQEEIDGLSRYRNQELQATITAPEYTTETLAAMESIGSLFKPEEHYTKEEEDLTWTNPYQRFEPVYRPPVNENE